jgi:hypothetical protein
MTGIAADRAVTLPFSRDRVIGIAIAAALLAAMVLPELGYVPVWDGRVYANCVADAAFTTISMESLRCANHPSQGWAIWLALTQVFAPGSIAAIHLMDLAQGILALVAFRVVLARVFPDPAHARGLDLVTIAAAVHPVVVSTLLQPNVDFGVYVWFFVALAALLSSGRKASVIAVIGGIFLAFSKETGVLAYAFAVGMSLAVRWMRRDGKTLRQLIDAHLGQTAFLLVPLALFGLHVEMWDRTHGINAIWRHGWQQTTADGFKFFDLSEPIFVSYAAGLFVLGFMWVAWIPVVLDGARGLAGMARRRPTRMVPGADEAVLVWLTVFTVALTYVLTSFRTWSNLRYFALLYPLFLLLTYAALVRLGASRRVRYAAFGAIIALFTIAAYRSVDPLSRAVYGTFDAGEKRMYRMTSITQEFEGPGRDQLVYNLEFTGFHHVQNALFEQMKPNETTVIGTPRHVRWNIWSQLESGTMRRSMRRDGVFAPVYADEVDIMTRGAREAWFLDFSNHGDEDHALDVLRRFYSVTDSLTAVARGHKVTAHRLVRREAATLP